MPAIIVWKRHYGRLVDPRLQPNANKECGLLQSLDSNICVKSADGCDAFKLDAKTESETLIGDSSLRSAASKETSQFKANGLSDFNDVWKPNVHLHTGDAKAGDADVVCDNLGEKKMPTGPDNTCDPKGSARPEKSKNHVALCEPNNESKLSPTSTKNVKLNSSDYRNHRGDCIDYGDRGAAYHWSAGTKCIKFRANEARPSHNFLFIYYFDFQSLQSEWRLVFWITFFTHVIKVMLFTTWGSGKIQPWDSQHRSTKELTVDLIEKNTNRNDSNNK